MMMVLKKGVEFDFNMINDEEIYYLLEPKDNSTLRNIIEPIIYSFFAKILKYLAQESDQITV
jgi:hypothetical protein